jgi:thiosulfate dehydrogenase [quinone] large subunit
MAQWRNILFFLTRTGLGWLFFWAGITKVLNPAWSAAGYLDNAKTFAGFYHWVASPAILPVVNFVNAWGLTLLGISVILGVGMRISAPLGALLMMLYYFPILGFPYPNHHAFIVDEHIIYALLLLLLSALRESRVGGVGTWYKRLPAWMD